MNGSSAFPNPDVSESPVRPLGYDGPYIAFLMPEGNRRSVIAGQVASWLQSDIYACEAGQTFLENWRDDDDAIDRQAAARWLIRACRAAGPYDAFSPARDGLRIGGNGSLAERSNRTRPDSDVVHQRVENSQIGGRDRSRSNPLDQTAQVADAVATLAKLCRHTKHDVEKVDLDPMRRDRRLQRRDPLLTRLFHRLTSLGVRAGSSTESGPARKSETGR